VGHAPPTRPSAGALVLAASLFVVFRHASYDPSVSLGVGSTSVDVGMADLGVLAAVVAAAVSLARDGVPSVTRAGRLVLLAAAAFCVWLVAATLYGPAVSETYELRPSLVSAATWIEYALLAGAAVVLVRTRAAALAVLAAFVALSVAATAWGVLQFLGLVDEFEGRRPLQREVSFLGNHDFAAVSAAALAIAFAALALDARGRLRRLVWPAAVAGAVGAILAAAVATVAAIVVCAAAALAAGRRARTLDRAAALAIAGLLAAVALGTTTLRSGDLADAVHFLGIEREQGPETGLQTYSHRTVLAYIGLRTFADHPLLGTGWQGSLLEESYGPYLADAHRRFPEVTGEAFPSPEHPWGVQNAFVQAGSDLGLPGLLLLVGFVLGGLALAGVTVLRSPPAAAALALVAFSGLVVGAAGWAALGLVPGIPTTALVWLALGGAVASAAERTTKEA
jgi:O-antigen ligase